jgi:hypothetical protein
VVLLPDAKADLNEVDSDLCQSIRDALEKCRATNILSETRFARIAAQLWQSKKGRSAALATMSNKYTLAEFKHQHNLAIGRWNESHGRRRDASAAPVPAPPTVSPKAMSGWHEYVRQFRDNKSMKVIAAEWNALDLHERNTYEERAERRRLEYEQEAAGGDDEEERRLQHDLQAHTPFGCGDCEFPLREDFVADLGKSKCLKEHAKKFEDSVATLVDGSGKAFPSIALTRMCGEIYGIGRRATAYTDEQRKTFNDTLDRLNVVAKFTREQGDLQLFMFTSGTHFVLLLSCFSLLLDPKAQLFMRLKTVDGRHPEPGSQMFLSRAEDVANLRSGFWPDVELAQLTVDLGGEWLTKHVKYHMEHTELDNGKTSMVLVAESVCDLVFEKKPKQSPEDKALAQAVQAAKRAVRESAPRASAKPRPKQDTIT